MTIEEDKDPRITWRNKFEFAFNVIGYNVGLGNIWRFSYLCFKNGGGAFLIPYLLSAVIVGVPLLFMEVAMGQFTRHGCIAAWDILPIMKGIGFSGIIISFLFEIFFVVVMSWCVFYFFNSFAIGELSWATCDNWWNTVNCVPIGDDQGHEQNASIGIHSSAAYGQYNMSNRSQAAGIAAPAEFFNNYVLQRSSGIEDFGGFHNWKMVGCFLLCWLASYLCICKGIRTSGKAAYVTVIAPYVLMLALFIRGITLEGASEGIRFYITPNVTKLMEPAVWLDGGTQVIFSLAVCNGCFYGMGSYNKFSFDCYKSSYFFVMTCCFSSLFFGFVVFSFLGHMAFIQGKNVSDIADGGWFIKVCEWPFVYALPTTDNDEDSQTFEIGPELVFIVFPNAFNTLPAPQAWAAAFFLGLTFLAIDGVFTVVEGSVTALADYWPQYFSHKGTQIWRAGFCLTLVVLSLPQFANNGIYIFEIINRYGASGIALLWAAIFESMAVGWVYGIDRFWDDVKSMIGYYPSNAFKYCFKYVTPSFCLIIFITCCVQYTPLTLGSYTYPWWGDGVGWILSLMSMLSIPVVGIYVVYTSPGETFRKKCENASMSRLDTKVAVLGSESEMKKMIGNV